MEARLAVVEAKVDDLRIDAIHREEKQDEILEIVHELQKDIARARSAVGAVIWVVGGMFTFVWKIGPWIAGLLKLKTGNG
jgi:hypothetical protein